MKENREQPIPEDLSITTGCDQCGDLEIQLDFSRGGMTKQGGVYMVSGVAQETGDFPPRHPYAVSIRLDYLLNFTTYFSEVISYVRDLHNQRFHPHIVAKMPRYSKN